MGCCSANNRSKASSLIKSSNIPKDLYTLNAKTTSLTSGRKFGILQPMFRNNSLRSSTDQYEQCGPKANGIKMSRKQSEEVNNKYKEYFQYQNSKNHMMHLCESLSKHANMNKDDNIHGQYIDWEAHLSLNGNITWNNKGIAVISLDDMISIASLSFGEISHRSFLHKRIWVLCFIKANIIDSIADNPVLVISRDNIIDDSYNQIQNNKELNLRRVLHIYFIDEVANDVGGLFREWYNSIFKAFFLPKKQLFIQNNSNGYGKYTMLPTKSKTDNNQLLFYYEFFGKILAKSLIDQIMLSQKLNRVILRILKNELITLEDMRYYDNDLYKSLLSIQNDNNNYAYGNGNEIDGLTFTWNIRNENNELIQYDLIANGSKIKVNKDNKEDYIKRVIQYVGYEQYKDKIEMIKKGFESIIPGDFMKIFTIEELEFLLCGKSDIDINDWRKNTIYKGGYSKEHNSIAMFWKVLGEFNRDELEKFFTFSTGYVRVPMNGFAALQSSKGENALFCIENKGTCEGGYTLIEAKTCFNMICLPQYKTIDDMRRAMRYVTDFDVDFLGIE